MEIKKGSDRIALVGENTTMKVPNLDKFKRLKSGYSWYKNHGLKGLKVWLNFGPKDGDGPRYILLHGLHANLRESKLANQFPDLVLPTRSFLHGVLNVQPTVPEAELDFMELMRSFADHLDNAVVEIGHTLERPGNFGIHENRVKFIDAGSDRLAKLLYARRGDIEKSLRSVEEKIGLK